MAMFPDAYSPYAYAICRIVSGFLFLCHGLGKIFGMFDSTVAQFGTLRWTAGALELGLGALIAVGLFTAIAAFLASGEMAVAYFRSHQPDGALPIQNDGELAALYSFVFLFMAAHGSGRWSLDAFRHRKS